CQRRRQNSTDLDRVCPAEVAACPSSYKGCCDEHRASLFSPASLPCCAALDHTAIGLLGSCLPSGPGSFSLEELGHRRQALPGPALLAAAARPSGETSTI